MALAASVSAPSGVAHPATAPTLAPMMAPIGPPARAPMPPPARPPEAARCVVSLPQAAVRRLTAITLISPVRMTNPLPVLTAEISTARFAGGFCKNLSWFSDRAETFHPRDRDFFNSHVAFARSEIAAGAVRAAIALTRDALPARRRAAYEAQDCAVL